MFCEFGNVSCVLPTGQRIAAHAMGKGPAVLLLHGFPQTKAMWAKVAPLLAQNFRVVVADLRGYGDSDKPKPTDNADNYSFRLMGQDMAALMQGLGHTYFHLIGHDRGGRVAHRMALDYSARITSLAVLDIVPTHALFNSFDRHVAKAYWHWFFLSQPAPFPQTMIEAAPDMFFETCLTGWGKAGLSVFDPAALADYRRAWRDKATIAAMCADYRAAALVDILDDEQSLQTKVTCPTLVYYGADGVMAQHYDLGHVWSDYATNITLQSEKGGHFFIDQYPHEVAQKLMHYLKQNESALPA